MIQKKNYPTRRPTAYLNYLCKRAAYSMFRPDRSAYIQSGLIDAGPSTASEKEEPTSSPARKGPHQEQRRR